MPPTPTDAAEPRSLADRLFGGNPIYWIIHARTAERPWWRAPEAWAVRLAWVLVAADALRIFAAPGAWRHPLGPRFGGLAFVACGLFPLLLTPTGIAFERDRSTFEGLLLTPTPLRTIVGGLVRAQLRPFAVFLAGSLPAFVSWGLLLPVELSLRTEWAGTYRVDLASLSWGAAEGLIYWGACAAAVYSASCIGIWAAGSSASSAGGVALALMMGITPLFMGGVILLMFAADGIGAFPVAQVEELAKLVGGNALLWLPASASLRRLGYDRLEHGGAFRRRTLEESGEDA